MSVVAPKVPLSTQRDVLYELTHGWNIFATSPKVEPFERVTAYLDRAQIDSLVASYSFINAFAGFPEQNVRLFYASGGMVECPTDAIRRFIESRGRRV